LKKTRRRLRPAADQGSFGLPLGMTAVCGGLGRSEPICFGGEVSFFGFFAILLLRCSPLAMEESSGVSHGVQLLTGMVMQQAHEKCPVRKLFRARH
jgi:hypothetical protein